MRSLIRSHCTVDSHAHKHTVMDVKWNRNGNWLLTASRDHLIKLFDVRNMKDEVIAFRGHKKEATGGYTYIIAVQTNFLQICCNKGAMFS